MLIEAVNRPILCRFPGGEFRLEPGKPIDVPDERAKRLLNKAGNKVRMVPPTIAAGSQITWTRGDGTAHTGLIDVTHVDEDGQHWVFVTIGETWAVVNMKFVTGSSDA